MSRQTSLASGHLDVQADEFGFGAALFQDVPFFHQAGFAAPMWSAICPAFVVRYDDDQVHIGFFAVQQGERCATCRSAAADIGEFFGVGHDAVARALVMMLSRGLSCTFTVICSNGITRAFGLVRNMAADTSAAMSMQRVLLVALPR